MTIKRLPAFAALIVGMLGPIQAQADEAHLITSLGKPSPEYAAAVEELNAKFDEFAARCDEDASACDYSTSLDPYFERLDTILEEHPNRAKVTVRGLEEPTTLVLSSPMPIVWRVKGAGIKKIILVGNGRSRVKLSEALQDVEVQDLSEQLTIGAFEDDRRQVVAYSEFNFESGKQYCPTEVDESVVEMFPSELNRSIDGLEQLGLELASAQADLGEDEPSYRFRVNRKTKGVFLSDSLRGYLCYQEPDGSLVDGETLLARQSQ
jgi:hypothetical protein